jgi:hypothetical protein
VAVPLPVVVPLPLPAPPLLPALKNLSSILKIM